MLDTVHISLSEIQWDILEVQNKLVMYYLRIWKTVLEQPLASTYMLHYYKLYWLHILEEDLEELRGLNHWKITRYRYATANTEKVC